MQFYPVVEPGPYELLKCHALRIKQQFHGVCCHFPIHGSSGICVQTSHSVGANIVDVFSCIQPANLCSRVCTLMGSLGRLCPSLSDKFQPQNTPNLPNPALDNSALEQAHFLEKGSITISIPSVEEICQTTSKYRSTSFSI